MSGARCAACECDLPPSQPAWAADWTVIAAEGTRTETRYTCDDCHDWDEKVAMTAPDPTPCPSCDGEGYRYFEQAGRFGDHPATCTRCDGTGLIEKDDA